MLVDVQKEIEKLKHIIETMAIRHASHDQYPVVLQLIIEDLQELQNNIINWEKKVDRD